VDEYVLSTALALPTHRFVIAGSGWDASAWPENLELLTAAGEHEKAIIYSSARLVLVPVMAKSIDHALPPELLEPVACNTTCIALDRPGLAGFFTPDREILVPSSARDLIGYLTSYDEASLLAMANNAAKRLLEKYAKLPRSRQFEQRVAKKFFGA
jgi:hypothetical protein